MDDSRIAEILKGLEVYDGTYRRAQVDAALELQEEITPHLIGVLEEVLSDPPAYASRQDYHAHVYALILLGHFREHRAHRTIVELFSLPPDIPYELFGNLITEILPIILFRTCNGSMDMIKSLVLNRNADEFCRGSAAKAMAFAAADGMIPREEVQVFFGSLFTGDEAAPESMFWSLLASCVRNLYPARLMGVIEKAFRDGLISPGFIEYESFEHTLRGSREQALRRVKAEIRRESPENVHDYMSWWACFRPEETSPSVSAPSPGTSVPSVAPSRRSPSKKSKRKKSKRSGKIAGRKKKRRSKASKKRRRR